MVGGPVDNLLTEEEYTKDVSSIEEYNEENRIMNDGGYTSTEYMPVRDEELDSRLDDLSREVEAGLPGEGPDVDPKWEGQFKSGPGETF